MRNPLEASARAASVASCVLVLGMLAQPTQGQCGSTIFYGVTTPGAARGIALVGNTAYVADTAGLQVIDMSIPVMPTIIGSVNTPDQAYDIVISSTLAFVADGLSGLQVIDVSDSTNPTILGAVDTPGFALGVAVVGSTVYVADLGSGLQVIDVSDPDPLNWAIIGSVDTPGIARGVVVSGTQAYIADGASGLQVIDISDPTMPAIIGTLASLAETLGIAVEGDVLYMADGSAGFRVIDVSDPTIPSPIVTAGVATVGVAYSVVLSDTLAFVAEQDRGYNVIDISPPTNNAWSIGFGVGGGLYNDIAVVGTLVVLAASTDGLRVATVEDCGLLGACCVGSGCIISTEFSCDNLGGDFLGTGSSCLTAPCPTPCPADFIGSMNGPPDGLVGIAEFLKVLADWGACP